MARPVCVNLCILPTSLATIGSHPATQHKSTRPV